MQRYGFSEETISAAVESWAKGEETYAQIASRLGCKKSVIVTQIENYILHGPLAEVVKEYCPEPGVRPGRYLGRLSNIDLDGKRANWHIWHSGIRGTRFWRELVLRLVQRRRVEMKDKEFYIDQSVVRSGPPPMNEKDKLHIKLVCLECVSRNASSSTFGDLVITAKRLYNIVLDDWGVTPVDTESPNEERFAVDECMARE